VTERIRRLRLAIFGALAMMLATLIGLTGYALWLLRADTLANGLDTAALLTRSIEDYVTRSLQVTELAGANALPPAQMLGQWLQIGQAFDQTLRHAPHLRSISLQDEEGVILASSNPANIGRIISNELFLPVVQGAGSGLRIGPLWSGRDFDLGQTASASTSENEDLPSFIPVITNLVRGERNLTLLFALNPEHFRHYMTQQLAPDAGLVTLARLDGTPLITTGTKASVSVVWQSAAEKALRLNEREFGQFAQFKPDPSGGLHTLSAYRVSSVYPFVVMTHLKRDHVLQRFRTEANTILGILIPSLLIIAWLSVAFFRRQVLIEHQRAEAQRLQQINAAMVFSHTSEGILITDAAANILDVNNAFSLITGFSREEVLGKKPSLLSSGRQDTAFYANMWQDLNLHGQWRGEIWNRRKDGEVFAELLTISAVADSQGQVQQYVALFSNITAAKLLQDRLENLAHFDALTQLPNRILLADRLQQAMYQGQRRGSQVAVVFIDLDGFKAINDIHGHDVGDQLLIAVSQRMRLVLRDGDTLSRQGGDEFVAVLVDLTNASACTPLLQRLLDAASAPVHAGKRVVQVSASMGVTFFPQHQEIDGDQLLRQADQAMYQAKQSGKNRYHFFDTEHDRNVRCHHESLERIRLALDKREFILFYQPKVNMCTGMVIGAEALIRWMHPERGLLAPADFLPLIADHPMAIEVGEWVLDTAMAQIEYWKRDGLALPVSVNIDAIHLGQTDFVERLQQRLAAHPSVAADDLELEVLETSALQDVDNVSSLILACHEIGVGFALDDFGTGYSSLTYLKRLPAGLLKIDQTFVREMLDDPDDLAILDGVLSLARAFRRQSIAEGVETTAHGEILLQLGCQLAQGYAIARPMPAKDMLVWLETWRAPSSWLNQAPISRDELSILFFCVEHRAWIMKVASFVRGERDAAAPLHHEKCPVEQWLSGEDCLRKESRPAIEVLRDLHIEIHELASELIRLKLDGLIDAAIAQLSELDRLRDRLLVLFLEMLAQVRAEQGPQEQRR
jgi:diguanylate cyclase (GGDEF)-like protein/PAS domain S-box-containing protein